MLFTVNDELVRGGITGKNNSHKMVSDLQAAAEPILVHWVFGCREQHCSELGSQGTVHPTQMHSPVSCNTFCTLKFREHYKQGISVLGHPHYSLPPLLFATHSGKRQLCPGLSFPLVTPDASVEIRQNVPCPSAGCEEPLHSNDLTMGMNSGIILFWRTASQFTSDRYGKDWMSFS